MAMMMMMMVMMKENIKKKTKREAVENIAFCLKRRHDEKEECLFVVWFWIAEAARHYSLLPFHSYCNTALSTCMYVYINSPS